MMMKGENTYLTFRTLITGMVEKEKFFNVDDNWPAIEKIIQSKEFDFLLKSVNGFISIFNFKTGFYEFMSEGMTFNLGHPVKNFIGESGVHFVYAVMHEDHATYFVEVIMKEVLEYLSAHANSETGTDYKFSCTLKLRDIHGHYKWFMLDTVVIQTDENGFPLRTMISCTNIESIKKDNLIYFNIMKKGGQGMYEILYEGYNNNRMPEIRLTTRETEILALIAQGLTNEKIGLELFISTQTVKSHRKNILNKTKCRGTAELTTFAFSRGLL